MRYQTAVLSELEPSSPLILSLIGATLGTVTVSGLFGSDESAVVQKRQVVVDDCFGMLC